MSTWVFRISYLVLICAGVSVWIFSRVRPLQIAPFGELLRKMMVSRVNRVAIFAIWWWVGWHFFGQPFPN